MTASTLPSTTSGTSETAKYIAAKREDNYNLLQNSNVLGLAAKGTFQRLEDIFEECSFLGWDGGEANPISNETFRNTCEFLDSLPLGVHTPEISADPDGAITLEWYHSPRKILSVSINPDASFDYAALIGLKKRHGSDYIEGGVSEDITSLIYEIFFVLPMPMSEKTKKWDRLYLRGTIPEPHD